MHPLMPSTAYGRVACTRSTALAPSGRALRLRRHHDVCSVQPPRRLQSTSTTPFPFADAPSAGMIADSIRSATNSLLHSIRDNVQLQAPFDKVHIQPAASPEQPPQCTAAMASGVNNNDWPSYHAQHYIPLSPAQRALLFASSAAISTINTHRGDLVAAVGELVPNNHTVLRQLHRRMQQSEEGRRVLHLNPRIRDDSDTHATAATNVWSLAHLSTLAPNTLGGVYYKFMSSHGYTSNDRSPVRFEADSEYAYIIQRYREIHDIWHILLGFDVTVLDELAQKYFEYLHTSLPLGYLSYLIAPLKLSANDLHTLYTSYVPALQQINGQCIDLVCVMYEDYLHEDISVLRQRWKIFKVGDRED